jgi:protein-disulfide isomerase
MPQTFLRILSATALATVLGPLLGVACARSDTSSTGQTSASTSASASSASVANAAGAVAGGTANAQVPHDSINDRADAGRIMGNANAKIWVVMASDFQCPFCKAWHDADFQKLVKDYVATGRVRLAFLNMPLSIHPNALPAAEAAMCASVQNKFWPMQEALFATQAKWEEMPDPTPMLDSLAFANGVSMPAWRQCVKNHSTLSLIQADHDRATHSGAGSTPTFFVDGERLEGADTKLGPVIDSALAKAAKKPAS